MARKPIRPGNKRGTSASRSKTSPKRAAPRKSGSSPGAPSPSKTQRLSAARKSEPDEPLGTAETALPSLTRADPSALRDGKLYYRIGEVSQITGVKPYVLRYWESEFRLMAPQKSRSKQRLYRRKDIETILHIKQLLYEERYTIAGARRRLRELGADRVREEGRLGQQALPRTTDESASAVAGVPLDAVLAELREIRALLAPDL